MPLPIFQSGTPFVSGKDKVAACGQALCWGWWTLSGALMTNNTVVTHKRTLQHPHASLFEIHMIRVLQQSWYSYSSINGSIMMHAKPWIGYRFSQEETHVQGKTRILADQGFCHLRDWEGIDRITYPPHKKYSYSILESVMVPYNYTEFINGLTDLVNKKAIRIQRIDDAVKRILEGQVRNGSLRNFPLADLQFR
ncbi:hypothetical protein NC651_019188 [Populus alba x Populus x berolinensis]|nr:hypothetical protein NC651_019188 [Populus alba x Populus x berolinensis]